MASTSISLGATRSPAPSPSLTIEIVCVPWASFSRPSIQCSIVKAIAANAGHTAGVHYLNHELAAEIGADAYAEIAEGRHQHQLVGEWLFSAAAFGDQSHDFDEYIARHPKLSALWDDIEMTIEQVRDLRHHVIPAFVDRWAADERWRNVDVAAFSSTFEQNTASLALAGALKARWPQITTLFGGSNLDGSMGIEMVRSFDQIDVAVRGEAEKALPIVLDAIARNGDTLRAPGAMARRDGEVAFGLDATVLEDLNESPLPDHFDYFESVERHQRTFASKNAGYRIPFETARGCWWGQKHHCTFCGLNGETMRYRSKSPERALADIQELSSRHRKTIFESVDNILDLRYLPVMMQQLADGDLDFSMFYELKANLRRDQVRLLALAGVDTIQPGIESLSTHVLKLMRKGTTTLQNVRLLKWAKYYGICVNWNLLMGFPGEQEEDYRQQWELIPSLYHLQPPDGAIRVWLERFSPLFTDPSFPVHSVEPQFAYSQVYPKGVRVEELAYFFEYEADDLLDLAHYRKLVAATTEWISHWDVASPSLVAKRGHDWTEIIDSRFGSAQTMTLTGLPAAITRACSERELGVDKIATALADQNITASTSEIEEVLAGLVERRLVASADEKYLFLALPWRVR